MPLDPDEIGPLLARSAVETVVGVALTPGAMPPPSVPGQIALPPREAAAWRGFWALMGIQALVVGVCALFLEPPATVIASVVALPVTLLLLVAHLTGALQRTDEANRLVHGLGQRRNEFDRLVTCHHGPLWLAVRAPRELHGALGCAAVPLVLLSDELWAAVLLLGLLPDSRHPAVVVFRSPNVTVDLPASAEPMVESLEWWKQTELKHERFHLDPPQREGARSHEFVTVLKISSAEAVAEVLNSLVTTARAVEPPTTDAHAAAGA